MGIQMRLPKEVNHLHYDFEQAYWCIEHITFSNVSGVNMVNFTFSAYPSRECKVMTGANVDSTLSWGTPNAMAVQGRLYKLNACILSSQIFPNGIPILEAEQKNVLYAFLKQYLNLSNYIDILEG